MKLDTLARRYAEEARKTVTNAQPPAVEQLVKADRRGRLVAGIVWTAAATMVAIGAVVVLGPAGGPTPSLLDPAGTVATTAPVVNTTLPTTTSVPTPVVVESQPGELPFLLVDFPGMEITYHSDDTHQRSERISGFGLVAMFRNPTLGYGGPLLAVDRYSTDSYGLSGDEVEVGGRPAVVMEGVAGPRTVIVAIDEGDGTLTVLHGVGLSRDEVLEAARSLIVSPDGSGVEITPPSGLEEVALDTGTGAGTIRYRETQYQGPVGSVEVRTWTGTVRDLEAQILNRAEEADTGAAPNYQTELIGLPVLVAPQLNADQAGGRWFVVGGATDYLIELDVSGNEAGFVDQILASIRQVDQTTLEERFPPDFVRTADLDTTVAAMLDGVPLPSNLDPEAFDQLVGGSHYVIGAQVIGTVVCGWLDQWVTASPSGDDASAQEASEALSTSRQWQTLQDMSQQGDYPLVVWEYADAIAGDGTVIGGRTLTVEESYQRALGCPTP
jgi:hypothetical protein